MKNSTATKLSLKFNKLMLKFVNFRIALKLIGNKKLTYDQLRSEHRKLSEELTDITKELETLSHRFHDNAASVNRLGFEEELKKSTILLENSNEFIVSYIDGDWDMVQVHFSDFFNNASQIGYTSTWLRSEMDYDAFFKEHRDVKRGLQLGSITKEPLSIEQKKNMKLFEDIQIPAYQCGKKILLATGKLVETEDGKCVVKEKNDGLMDQALFDEICGFVEKENEFISIDKKAEKTKLLNQQKETIEKRIKELEEKIKSFGVAELEKKKNSLEKEIEYDCTKLEKYE